MNLYKVKIEGFSADEFYVIAKDFQDAADKMKEYCVSSRKILSVEIIAETNKSGIAMHNPSYKLVL